jgi:hypothetical protein
MSTQTINKSFIIHKDSLSVLNKLTDEQAGKLFKAIFNYQTNNVLPEDTLISIIFEPFLNQFKRDDIKYQNVVERNKINGSKGGRPKTQENPLGYLETQENPRKPKKADSDSDSDSKNDNKNDIILNNISIDFQEFYNNYPLQGTKAKGNKASSEKKYNSLRKNGVSKEDLNNALANYKEEIKANSWQQTKRVEFWLTKWETYQLTDNKQELKQIENKLKEIEPLANIQIKEKSIIIKMPTFETFRLHKEIINKEIKALCDNIGLSMQLTHN